MDLRWARVYRHSHVILHGLFYFIIVASKMANFVFFITNVFQIHMNKYV